MPAFAEEHGSRAQGGLALACLAFGSLIGGVWIGTRPAARRLDLRFTLSLAALALAFVPPLVAPSLPVMCVLMLIAGMPIAPAFAASYGLVGRAGSGRHDDGGLRVAGHGGRGGCRARHVVRRLRGRAVRPARRARIRRSVRGRRGAPDVRAPCVAGHPGPASVTPMPERAPSRRHRRHRQGRRLDRVAARRPRDRSDPARARRRAGAGSPGRRCGGGRLPRSRLGACRAPPGRSRLHGQRARGGRAAHRRAPLVHRRGRRGRRRARGLPLDRQPLADCGLPSRALALRDRADAPRERAALRVPAHEPLPGRSAAVVRPGRRLPRPGRRRPGLADLARGHRCGLGGRARGARLRGRGARSDR